MIAKRYRRALAGSAAAGAAITGVRLHRRYRTEIALAYHRVSNGGRTIATPSGPIRYSERGAGAPVLIVHGAGGGYDQGEYFAGVIGGDFRWIAPSRFGFTGTPVPEGADAALQADAYACLLDALKIARAGVVGVSMGGPSALLFAQRHPQRTTSLALVSAASHAISPRPAALAALFKVFLDDFVFWAMVRFGPAGLLAALGVPPAIQRKLPAGETRALRAFLESILPMGARRSGQLLEQHMSEYDSEKIRAIRAPTLVLHARDDTLVPFEHGEYAAENIPGAELISMTSGGHLALLLRDSAEERGILLRFLNTYSGRLRN